MMQTITEKWLREVKACNEAIDAFMEHSHGTRDPIRLLHRLMHPKTRRMVLQVFGYDTLDWAVWLTASLLNREDRVRLAIYAAEQVLPVYEQYDPYDRIPRDAIEAAKSWLDDRGQTCACKYSSERVDESLSSLSSLVPYQEAALYAARTAKFCAFTAALRRRDDVIFTCNAAYHSALYAVDRKAGYKLQRKIIRYGIQLIEERG